MSILDTRLSRLTTNFAVSNQKFCFFDSHKMVNDLLEDLWRQLQQR
jgi:hypothetical protein